MTGHTQTPASFFLQQKKKKKNVTENLEAWRLHPTSHCPASDRNPPYLSPKSGC